MVTGAETPQLHLFCILDLLCVAVAPLYRHVGVGIGVDKDIEGAVSIKDW